MRIFGLTLLVVLAGVVTAQPQSPFQPVGNVSQVMIDIIYPTSDALFYIERNPPKNDRDWNAIRGAALTLAESGNLLLMGSRARDQDRWAKDTKLLIDAGMAAFKAAQKKDMQAILDLNEQLTASCTTCHRHYRPNYGK
jgi:cytochrome c556